jgi:ankyrin repeat protein
MKTIRILFLIIFSTLGALAYAQELPDQVVKALNTDDANALKLFVTKDNVNNCYGYYSMLSNAIRAGAKNCFDLIVATGADVNQTCSGYIPPLMHAAKYGHLDMVKALIEKGAKLDYKYNGTIKTQNGPEQGDTPFTYAERYHHDDIAQYLKSVKK